VALVAFYLFNTLFYRRKVACFKCAAPTISTFNEDGSSTIQNVFSRLKSMRLPEPRRGQKTNNSLPQLKQL